MLQEKSLKGIELPEAAFHSSHTLPIEEIEDDFEVFFGRRKLDPESTVVVHRILEEIREKNSVKAGEYSINLPEPCIYRVPSRIRDLKPAAYIPGILVIGPLHRENPTEGAPTEGAATSSKSWNVKEGYSYMEGIKVMYMESFTERVGKDTIELMRKIIHANENKIRNCYIDKREWINSEDYVDLILDDSVFIVELIIRFHEQPSFYKTMEEAQALKETFPFDISRARIDLMMLENQLPFFILDSFLSALSILLLGETDLTEIILRLIFRVVTDFTGNFTHFTDLLRCVCENSLAEDMKKDNHRDWVHVTGLRNVEKLSEAGVDFKPSGDVVNFARSLQKVRNLKGRVTPSRRESRLSLHVAFEKGALSMPQFNANPITDMYLRNVIAYEQCHHNRVLPLTSNYIHFLNLLITSAGDVELLIEEGLVLDPLDRPSLVLNMVKSLQKGLRRWEPSQYYRIVEDLEIHSKSRRKRNWVILKRVYFSNLWTGTATIGAVLLLLMTLVSTVASVIQAVKK